MKTRAIIASAARIVSTSLLMVYSFTALAQKVQAPSLSDILENSLASVVTVSIYQTDYASTSVGRGSAATISEEAYREALDMGYNQSSGSGFVVDINGTKYVVTNYHVISDASAQPGSIQVFSISRKPYEAKVVGGDPFYDIAVLEFVNPPGKEIASIKFRTDEPRIGERVFAIGNPLGAFPYSVSDGIISAKNRVRDGLTAKFGYLQTTATVIWGNSGGPIIDEKGRVVGINSYIEFADSPDGGQLWQSQINYALEAKLADRMSREIVTSRGRIVRAYIGIEFSYKAMGSDDGEENAYALEANVPPVITGVLPNSPASIVMRSKYGYTVTAVNGIEIRSMEELLGVMEEARPNQEMKFTLMRDSATMETVTVRTTELANVHLEEIALAVLKKEKSISLIENVPYVGINFQPSRFRMVTDGTGAVLPYGAASQWQVVAAGLDNGTYNLYKVESLKDVGAAIRLSSMSGMVDFKMLQPGADISTMTTFRLTLSDEANTIQAVLYY